MFAYDLDVFPDRKHNVVLTARTSEMLLVQPLNLNFKFCQVLFAPCVTDIAVTFAKLYHSFGHLADYFGFLCGLFTYVGNSSVNFKHEPRSTGLTIAIPSVVPPSKPAPFTIAAIPDQQVVEKDWHVVE